MGEVLLRYGVSGTTEIQLGWTAFGHERLRDAGGGGRNSSGVGDVTVALRHNLVNPDGSGVSVAVMPYATLPTGGATLGAGTWGVGVLLPMSVDLGGPSLALTLQADAAPDGDRSGRHLGYGAVLGFELAASDKISVTPEVSLYRDNDPEGHTTQALAGLSAGYQPDDNSQWDIGSNVGLNRNSPDIEVYFGYTKRF